VTYFEGFLVPVPESKREEYRKHASDGTPIFHEFGIQRTSKHGTATSRRAKSRISARP